MTPEMVIESGAAGSGDHHPDVGAAAAHRAGDGLLVSVFQAATQINEMTLSFIPKLLAIFARAGAGRAVDAERDGRLHPPSDLGHPGHDRLSVPTPRARAPAAPRASRA